MNSVFFCIRERERERGRERERERGREKEGEACNQMVCGYVNIYVRVKESRFMKK